MCSCLHAYQLLGSGVNPPVLLASPPSHADHSAVAGPSEHYTIVFNTFVFMQLCECTSGESRGGVAGQPPLSHALIHPIHPLTARPPPFWPRTSPAAVNQLNARKILDGSRVWEGLGDAPVFQGILASELALQVLIVQVGGRGPGRGGTGVDKG